MGEADLDIVRRLLAAGVDVEARDTLQRTALHYAAMHCNKEVVREMLVEHNANMFAGDYGNNTPFDEATSSYSASGKAALIECYGNKLTQEHGELALHAVLEAAEYTFAPFSYSHPRDNPLRIRLPLGKLTLEHFRTLLSTFDAEVFRSRDDGGKLPIHIACRNKVPTQILALISDHCPATLHMADYVGALPIHECCCGAVVDDCRLRFLVEQGGFGTLAARKQDGSLPLHLLCGSTNPLLRIVQYLIQSYPEAAAVRTNAGQYPFMIAASSTASLCVVYKLVRANPELVTLH